MSKKSNKMLLEVDRSLFEKNLMLKVRSSRKWKKVFCSSKFMYISPKVLGFNFRVQGLAVMQKGENICMY
jgi:hypothetical protein